MMPTAPQLNDLSQKHRVLEQKIEEALAHPSIDPIAVSELKREKLQLKDKITKLQDPVIQ